MHLATMIFLERLTRQVFLLPITKMKSKILALVLLFYGKVLCAQDQISENFDFEKIIENLLPQQEVDVDYNDFYDRLFSLYSNPFDLNSANRSDFQSLFFLTESQISEIINYRTAYGDFMSIYELLSLPSFDKETVRRLEPFIMIGQDKQESFKRSLQNPAIHDLFLRYQTIIEQKVGYSNPDTSSTGKVSTRYLGGPQRLYSRYLLAKPGRYSFGFTIEKDPGEKIMWDTKRSTYGMDYYSFHAMVENVGIFRRIALGDFSLDYGQGLVFGSGLSFGKGSETITTIRRNNLGLRPYRSVYENKDFSGMAVSTSISRFDFNLFYSFVKRDGMRRGDAEDDQDEYISSIQTIGLHRTPSELASKDQLTDRSLGGNLSFTSSNRQLEIGLNGIFTSYSIPIASGSRNYNQFEFEGKRNSVGSLYFNYYMKKAHLFSEMSISQSGGKAVVSGIIASLSSQVQASIHLRKYDKNYHSFYGTAFGENTRIANESGIYWGIKIFPIRRLIISAYLDIYRFPWLKYRVDKPSSGSDAMVAGSFQVNEKLSFRIQMRNKLAEINYKTNRVIDVEIVPKSTKRFALIMNYELSSIFSIQSRVQGSQVILNNEKATGFLLAQDVNLKRATYTLSGRFALFDSDTYDSRQFTYERDLLYLYSIPSFSNKGVRYYLVSKYRVSNNVDCWIKISQTKYFDQDTIGSGLETIMGNTKTSVNAQVRIKL